MRTSQARARKMYAEAGAMIGGSALDGSRHVGKLQAYLEKRHPGCAIIVGPYRFNAWTVYYLDTQCRERTIFTDLEQMFDRPSELSAMICGSPNTHNKACGSKIADCA